MEIQHFSGRPAVLSPANFLRRIINCNFPLLFFVVPLLLPAVNAVQYNAKSAPNGAASTTTKSENSQQPGPCTIMAGFSFPSLLPIVPGSLPIPALPTSSAGHRLKCTDKGYFELVQCFSDYCVCVDPSTGAEAIATRTTSPRLSPRCGRCQTQVARYFRDPNDFYFKPICEQKTGNYMPKQCKDDDHCFCVNVLNGVKLSKSEAPNQDTKCDETQLDFSIDASQVIKGEHLPSSIVTVVGGGVGGQLEPHQQIPIADPVCKLPKDSGRRCSGAGSPIAATGVKWYFDVETFECLAFAYNGCEGNKNRFDSVTECWEHCKLADFAGCAGMRLPATNAQGHTIICASMDPSAKSAGQEQCPSGYRCTMLAFMGVCCKSEFQDLYERNYRPQCEKGTKPTQMQAGGVPATLIGKTCDDKFCPSGTDCIAKEIFAHCCPR